MKRLFIAILVVTGVALVAGCDIGGEDRLSNEEFKQRATEIDNRVSNSFDAVFEEIGRPDRLGNKPVPEKAKTALAEAAQTEQEAVDELDDLNPPEEGQDAVDQLVEVAGAQADRLAAAAENPDLTGNEFLEAFEADDVDKPIDELVKLGLWPRQEEGQ
jgi:hypothetical protein